MLSFTFLTNPTADQIRQISYLYHTQRWMTDEEILEPDLIYRIISGSHSFLIACNEDEIVGMGRSISDRVSDAYIQDVMVKEGYRGKGIGLKIVKILMNRLYEDKMKWIGLIAEKGSENFYRKIGFEKMPGAVPMVTVIDDFSLKQHDIHDIVLL